MTPIKELLSAPKQWLYFVNEYVDMIRSFRFNIDTYKSDSRNKLAIQNTDLWIESYIDFVPELQEFRNEVRTEMEWLKIDRHPDYCYNKEYNHFYYSNKRSIEELRIIIQNFE